jgi:GTP-binding protein YchF
LRIAIVGYHGSGKTSIFSIVGGKPGGQEGKGGVSLLNLKVPDERLERIASEYKSAKISHAEITFVDVENISAGDKALTDEFLGHARSADALLLVVRAFMDENVYNPRGKVDPVKDVQDLCEELILSDYEVVENRLKKLDKELSRGRKECIPEQELLGRIMGSLEAGHALRKIQFKPEEERILSHFAFMSRKPGVCIVNVNFRTEKGTINETHDEALKNKMRGLVVPAQLEVELLEIEDRDEKLTYLQSYNYEELAADSIIRAAYESLGAITFYVANENEARALQLGRGSNAYEAAGKVHSDIQKGFIRAEVFNCSDLAEYGSVKGIRDAGKCNLEKKEYIVQDGDVIFFRFN